MSSTFDSYTSITKSFVSPYNVYLNNRGKDYVTDKFKNQVKLVLGLGVGLGFAELYTHLNSQQLLSRNIGLIKNFYLLGSLMYIFIQQNELQKQINYFDVVYALPPAAQVEIQRSIEMNKY